MVEHEIWEYLSRMNVDTLLADHAACDSLLRKSASSFSFPIRLLPKAKRQGTTALYAFCRKADDVVDEEPDKEIARKSLEHFENSLSAALAHERCDDPVLRAVVDSVRRFSIPVKYLYEILAGVRMDLDHRGYTSFEELHLYCQRVASAVGLAAIHIWGFHSDKVFIPADACGLAFQLTNILRDVPEDLSRGRIYIPAHDMLACGCSEADLKCGRIGKEFEELVAIEVSRAEILFDQARELDQYLSTDGRLIFRAMFGVYRGLLESVRAAGTSIFQTRIQPSKSVLVCKGLLAIAFGTKPWKVL